jgi:hypothetical protein
MPTAIHAQRTARATGTAREAPEGEGNERSADLGALDALEPDGPLRVAVLAKQVPMAEHLQLGPERRLRRQDVPVEMNPYCRRAVAKGVELARVSGGSCTVFTLGPPSAVEVLREAVAWGADRGVHLCAPSFAGSDSLATARALCAAMQLEGPLQPSEQW